MEWKKDIEELYEDITYQVPEAFRASAKPMLREAAEKTAWLRNSVFVSRDDLLSTLFENVERNYRIKDRIENFYKTYNFEIFLEKKLKTELKKWLKIRIR